jgi:hypothetical protein
MKGSLIARPVHAVVGLRLIETRRSVSLFVDFQDPQVIEGPGNHTNALIADKTSYLPVLTN